MSKISHEAWQAARLEWECTPSLTLQAVATRQGVALPTASNRAKKEGWLKLAQQAEERDMQHQVADVIGQIAGRDELLDKVGASLDLSIGTRVAVINKHRSELSRWRSLFPLEAMASDPVCARRAKLAAEALSIVQRSECVAFGLVTYTGASTDAPLVEQVEEVDKPKASWELLLESYITTGKSPAWSHESGHTPQQEVDPNAEDPFADDPPRVRLLPNIPPDLDGPDAPPSQH